MKRWRNFNFINVTFNFWSQLVFFLLIFLLQLYFFFFCWGLISNIEEFFCLIVGKVKGCLRVGTWIGKKREKGRYVLQSIFNLFFSVLSFHGALCFWKMSYMEMGTWVFSLFLFFCCALLHEMKWIVCLVRGFNEPHLKLH